MPALTMERFLRPGSGPKAPAPSIEVDRRSRAPAPTAFLQIFGGADCKNTLQAPHIWGQIGHFAIMRTKIVGSSPRSGLRIHAVPAWWGTFHPQYSYHRRRARIASGDRESGPTC